MLWLRKAKSQSVKKKRKRLILLVHSVIGSSRTAVWYKLFANVLKAKPVINFRN